MTSRREEESWLGELPRRIAVPPMPMTERLQLARALAAGRGRKVEMRNWRPLLAFSEGNPLTLTVLVGQALRDGLDGRAAVEAFVPRLRAGEAAFDDEAGKARSRSLGASLGYGFEHAFTEGERRQLPLLHLFQGFVNVQVLCAMGHPEEEWCLPEVRGLEREVAIALLDRAAEVGLLRPRGGGYYGIHPALPWFFRGLFDRHYGASPEAAVQAFVEAMGVLGNHYFWQYAGGNRDVIVALRAEESNLLQSRRLARANGWWDPVTSAMQGLRQLYTHTGRRAEWKRLVEEIVPDFVEPRAEGPREGREEDWSLVTEYRVQLALQERSWGEAERLQQVCVEWDRQQAAPLLVLLDAALEGTQLEGDQLNTIRSLAVSVETLGHIRREMSDQSCEPLYREALRLFLSIGKQQEAAVSAFNLGHAYREIAALRDLSQADYWYRRSLELRDERDRMGSGKILAQLGLVAFERFREVRSREKDEEELLRLLSKAVGFYTQTLEFLPPDAVQDLAVIHTISLAKSIEAQAMLIVRLRTTVMRSAIWSSKAMSIGRPEPAPMLP